MYLGVIFPPINDFHLLITPNGALIHKEPTGT